MLNDRALFVRDAVLCAGAYLTLTAVVTISNDRFGYADSELPWPGVAFLWAALFAPAPFVAVIAAAESAVSPTLRLRLYLLTMSATVITMEVTLLADVHFSTVMIVLTALCSGIALLFRRWRDV